MLKPLGQISGKGTSMTELTEVSYTVSINSEDVEAVIGNEDWVTQRHLEVASEVMAENQNFQQDLLDALIAAKSIVADEQEN